MFTGVDDRAGVVQAFARMLMTDTELATAARPPRADDGLDAWLSTR